MAALLVAASGAAAVAAQSSPLVARDQGGRPFAGRVLGDPATGSVHCDHGYVERQIPRTDGTMVPAGRSIPMSDFLKLKRMPIQIIWSDNIPSELDQMNVGPRRTLDSTRINVIRARLMVEAINRHGGDPTNVMLPDVGLHGNTHFPMSDLNNGKIADLLTQFLKTIGLDRR